MLEQTTTGGSCCIELLGSNNWMPWKCQMQAILRDLGIEEYIEEDSVLPVAKTPATEADIKVQKEWKTGDAKTWTWIKLAIRNVEMIHISSTTMAWEMWKQLMMVKKSRGWLGVLAMCQALYRATANESFEMVNHYSKLQKLQEELHIMKSLVPDEDFIMILITSLPEAWNDYTLAYLGSSRNKPELWSHQIIAILLVEDQRCKGQSGNTIDLALQAKGKNKHRKGKNDGDKKKCYNCKKKGHIVGQKVEAQKGKDHKGEEGWIEIDQIRPKKKISV